MATADLHITVDTAPAEDLTRRVTAAVADALKAASLVDLMIDRQAVTGLVASAVMAEVLRVRNLTDLTAGQRAAKISEIRTRLAAISDGPWEPRSHTHGAAGCRCLSCNDPAVGWTVDHPNALFCDDLVGARTADGELNDFGRPLDSCDEGPLLTYEDAAFAASAPEYVRFLLDEITRLTPAGGSDA